MEAGSRSLVWNALGQPSGLCFLKMQAGTFRAMRRMRRTKQDPNVCRKQKSPAPMRCRGFLSTKVKKDQRTVWPIKRYSSRRVL